MSLVLGLLGVCIVSVAAHAYVVRRIETTLDDFYTGTFLYTGLLDIPGEGIDSVQLMPIGLTGNWQLSANQLPQALVDLAAVGGNDRIYVIGGTNESTYTTQQVYSAQMNPEGDTSPWRAESPLPVPLAGAAAVFRAGSSDTSALYVIGGYDDDFSSLDTIYHAAVQNDTGEVGTWTELGQTLPVPLHYVSAVQHEGSIYIIGGYSSQSTPEARNTVYYASINQDGSLGAFSQTEALPQALFNSQAVVYHGESADTLYVIGGWNGQTASIQVYFADFLEGGELTGWTASQGSLPVPLWGHGGALVHGTEILVTGGIADSVDPITGISSTVKSALVDVDNPTFRLYDWCLGMGPPDCTIGAWQTGKLLPEVRALHGTVAGSTHIYVLGGQDASINPRDTVYFGSVTGQGALYSPDGIYRSKEMYLGSYPATLRKLTWEVTYGYPGDMSISMRYRTSWDGDHWTAWSETIPSNQGGNQHEPEPPPSGFRYVQYQASFSTAISIASPLLNEVEVFYEVADPDLAVNKDTGAVISATLGSDLQYNVNYTNTGAWQADKAYLTEILPEYTTYSGDASWHQVGSSNVYTYSLGTVPAGDTGSVPFRVRVDQQVPAGTTWINNTVEADYPPMIDAFNQTIVDPATEDNLYELRTPLNIYALQFTKRADPPANTVVAPGSFITYTIVYTNTGLRAVNQVVITDTFDPEGDYTIQASDPPPDLDSHVWNLDVLSGGLTGEIQIVVQLDDPMPNHWPVTNEASMSTLEGGLRDTPVLTHTVMNPEGTGMVDFVVERIGWEPAQPRVMSDSRFTATLTNQGTVDAAEPFWVALYIKPQPSETPESPADHDRGYCLYDCTTLRDHYVAYVWRLDAGASTLLTFESLEPDPEFPSLGCYDIYVQADVAFDTPDFNYYWGLYPEDYETNNILHQTLCIGQDGPPRVFLPIVSRKSP
ncbi:MAG: hypothetical protein M8467_10460 [Anaerolineae bacterium]|nr:hypothetical protein [Anaerolineae bacterium]